ncbi:hypothetical protein NUU61_005785 [Penicillium alfredii]|uniref:Uncharacterized protein n=1 Tax=Penicillium alfredii TaxID=1506179 RepID=A0A9W9FA68_9EURO|nr:uncharacterized protein NUU61_005785 [Penicillium alfredii]KAJ5096429.1 hypothetical protein NUU61_005785 [Penicillium alfredii]
MNQGRSMTRSFQGVCALTSQQYPLARQSMGFTKCQPNQCSLQRWRLEAFASRLQYEGIWLLNVGRPAILTPAGHGRVRLDTPNATEKGIAGAETCSRAPFLFPVMGPKTPGTP